MDTENTNGRIVRPNHPAKDAAVLILLGILVLVSRMPFLFAGYGDDSDGWAMVATARHIATSGQYAVSRFPGYPIPEIVYSFVWQGGPLVLNGITALFSVWAVVFFALALRRLGSRDYILAGLALAFTPVIYINSTVSMDYIWALAFISAGFYFVLLDKPVISGIFLGLAIGCRITSAIMIIPLLLMLIKPQQKWRNISALLKLSLTGCLVGVITFLPVILKYKTNFLIFYPADYPLLKGIIRTIGVNVWGRLGIIAIIIAALSLIIKFVIFRKRTHTPIPITKLHLIACLTAICLYFGLFLRLPYEAAYLIPTIPFIILVFDRLLFRRAFVLVCIILILSPFIVRPSHRGVFWGGAIVSDHLQRIERIKTLEQALHLVNNLPDKSVIVAGDWSGMIGSGYFPVPHNVSYVYLLDAAQLQKYIAEGFPVYYLPSQEGYNLSVYGVDITKQGAKPILPDAKY